MKRICLVLISLCVVSFLTGCGGTEKILECSKNQNTTGVESKEVYTFNFNKKDRYISGEFINEWILSKEVLKSVGLTSYKNIIENSIIKTNFKNMKYDIKDNGNDTISININVSKKDMETLSGSKNVTGSKEIKKAFEKENYICKLK